MRMRTLIALAFILCVVPQRSNSQQGRDSRNGFVDGVVDGTGQIYILRHNSIEMANSTEAPVPIPFDVKSTLTDPEFLSYGFHAIALNRKDQPAVLWSGVRQNRTAETYVTFISSRVSVRLGYPVVIATGLAFGPADDIFIFGLVRHQEPVSLVHHFTRDGTYLKSFHPHISASVEDVEATAKLGRSRVVATTNAVYVASPFVSGIVFEYSSTTGELVRQHDLGESTANGSRRKFLTIFARGGEALANSLVENGMSPISEIHRLKDDQLLMSIPATDLVGPVLGILPDGRAVGRNVSLSMQRDSIHIP